MRDYQIILGTMTSEGTGQTILLVEDDMGDALLFREVLSSSSYNSALIHVTSGEEALDYLNKRGRYSSTSIVPDIILMDLKLPKMGGLDLLRAIKNDHKLCSIPSVIFTGSDSPDEIRNAYSIGANGYVIKPIGLKRMETVVRTIEDYWFGTCHGPNSKNRY